MRLPSRAIPLTAWRAFVVATVVGVASGCSTDAMKVPHPLVEPASNGTTETNSSSTLDSAATGGEQAAAKKELEVSKTPQAPAPSQGGVVDRPDRLVLNDSKLDVTVNVEDVTLPAFINEVFGNILGQSFEIDNTLKNKNDRVTLRLEQPQTRQMVYNVASQVMSNYGVEIIKQGSVLRFQIKQIGLSPDEPPILISGDARPEVPIAYRPVFQFVQLHNVDGKDVIPWLNSAYDKAGLTASVDGARGGLMLKGMSSIVAQAAKAVQLLDQPFMRGQHSIRIDPAFLSADDLAKQLKALLTAQGYSVGIGEGAGSIVLVPLESSNGLIVFSNQQSLLHLVQEWAEQADRSPLANTISSGEGADNVGLYFYEVRNTRATDLAKSLRSLMSGLGGGSGAYGLTPDLTSSASQRATADSPPPVRSAQTSDMGGGRQSGVSPLLQLAGTQALLGATGNSNLMDSITSSVMGGGTIVEDENRNAILFRGPGKVWQQLQPILKQLDRPARQVLIEVTIASVALTDNESTGVSWGKNTPYNEGRVMNLSAGEGGFMYMLNTAGGAFATINALANDDRSRILATPRVLVKSGDQANINVGTDIPIVTGQQNDGSATNGSSNVLQSISYRSTGVILNVSPVIYSNNRVDMMVSQEVSSAGGGGGSSGGGGTGTSSGNPPITRTSLETALTLQSGGSVFMGGLIREDGDDGNGGVPVLKDIPWLGYLFGSRYRNKSRSEVVMLIQPYIIESADEIKEVTEKLKKMIEPALECNKAPGMCGI
ncbi:type II secretion system protein GspD [Pseudomonas sp. GD04087]|uniref:type II secretion system protein GspD n=1 Tax=unclassified Pseudomonas TaxID=196821 RepID=UPI00244B10F0|nr:MULTISPECIES: type II secretion system protein GspD [unclassified Pseudomonas]MDH0287777.1 type II secretion system protein GspD [Pseudomonas sp. GD04087]MDH1050798.1 type II secretion system protein GspD [Pseudomonas sp. GD03903]MDH2002780.1 type II secretion system protein GspD [Pseudomonas sp. GD03691]